MSIPIEVKYFISNICFSNFMRRCIFSNPNIAHVEKSIEIHTSVRAQFTFLTLLGETYPKKLGLIFLAFQSEFYV